MMLVVSKVRSRSHIISSSSMSSFLCMLWMILNMVMSVAAAAAVGDNTTSAVPTTVERLTNWPTTAPTASPTEESDAVEVSVGDVTIVLAFDSLFCIMLLLFHWFLAKNLRAIYCGRNNHISRNRQHPNFNRDRFLGWLSDVNQVSWHKVRELVGLDAYMFLRFIRMCGVIAGVSSFWSLLVLWPVYGTGSEDTNGWYTLSMANLANNDSRLWAGSLFMWALTGFVIWTMNNEYMHYIDLRLEFLGHAEGNMNPQCNYTLIIEQIPVDLQSDNALREYFDRLFPGKVYCASIVMNVPDLQKASSERRKILYRLEKALAYKEATGERPTHKAGSWAPSCLGIEFARFNSNERNPYLEDDFDESRIPVNGERVDSISYYRQKLVRINREVIELQQQKASLAESGNYLLSASNWISNMRGAVYSGVSTLGLTGDRNNNDELANLREYSDEFEFDDPRKDTSEEASSIGSITQYNGEEFESLGEPLVENVQPDARTYKAVDNARPGKDFEEKNFFQAFFGCLGFDFLIASCSFFSRTVETALVTGRSSTGFVTFTELGVVTSAVNSPLNHNPEILIVDVAPEPLDIVWKNVEVDLKQIEAKENSARILVAIGALFWSLPVAGIQYLANSKALDLSDFNETLGNFVNGYLPVVLLMILIMLLPIIFEWIAMAYETRKTFSGVQESVLKRYFIYLLANIYITVTSASVWDSLQDIIDNPSETTDLLGRSLPQVVGYFMSFILTKTLVGLPSTLIRWGDLSRYIFLYLSFSKDKMSQRELDIVYRKQVIKYGREYPNFLLVISICFTYACIAPVILPVAAIYFFFASYVYKTQLLHVFFPNYEGGGIMFPTACHRLLVGLICGQLTLIGYLTIKDAYSQATILFPAVLTTAYFMGYCQRTYVSTCASLTMERARLIDETLSPAVVRTFSANTYRQPVLNEIAAEPLPYRRLRGMDISEAIMTANEAI
mmetsp:Transcript_5824/g.8516  ORF Transcript_5824/g.8516 Transcript_5824/m.8516 type:complete len:960 (-) Transcript_5824:642-3521(-)